MTHDLFIKTYPADYEWLEYCLRSISKFTSGFRNTVVIYDPGDEPPPGVSIPVCALGEGCARRREGYLAQQAVKLYADVYTDADVIVMIDSDTIFTRPVTPQIYLNDAGLINWMMTPYDKIDAPWKPIVEKFLGEPVEFEFMRRHPFVIPRWLLCEIRAFCEEAHGVTLADYVMSQPPAAFSEFNALGAFAYKAFREEFHWVNTAEDIGFSKWPPLTVCQGWSWGGLKPEIRAEYEAILSAV